jgi:orc1/cdc6 family replication initiation protein
MLFNNIKKIVKEDGDKILSLDYMPPKIIGRNKEIADIAYLLSYILRSKNPTIPDMMAYGGPGTGKTTVVSYVLKELESEIKKRNDLDIKLKIVRIRGSECRTKYEALKKILFQIAPDMSASVSTYEIHDKIIQIISERGMNLLIFFDEVHELKDNELNNTMYTISRLGQDVSFCQTNKGTLENKEKGSIGYILISNDGNLRQKLKENTKSSLTRETIHFKRYAPEEIIEILQDRVNTALYPNTIEEGVLEYIAGASVKEGQDARYAIRLLFKSAIESERMGLPKISMEVVTKTNNVLIEEYLKSVLNDLPDLYLEILSIIRYLHLRDEIINSKTIWEVYNSRLYITSKVNFSRISQIVTMLEKEDIVYVSQSKRVGKLRNLSIEENLKEIEEVLREKGKID